MAALANVGTDNFHALRIARVVRETANAISVAFDVPAALATRFAFKPGQNVVLRRVIDGEELRRNYSICSLPGEPLKIAIKRVAGGRFSNMANDDFEAGQTIEVLPPQGRFVLPDGDGAPRHVLCIAAGVGITPIIGTVAKLLDTEPTAHVTLLYGNRSNELTLFRETLDDLKDRYLGCFSLAYIISAGAQDDSPLLHGRIDAEKLQVLAASVFAGSEISHAFLCGPGSMIKDLRAALFELGVPRDRVHHEFFAAGGGAYRAQPPKPAGAQSSTEPTAAGGDVDVTAILDGVRHRFTMGRGEHILDAAERAGVRAPYSCRGGMCCTCRARIVEGAAEMTVNYSLEPWEIERQFILTCQARPTTSRVVIDWDAM